VVPMFKSQDAKWNRGTVGASRKACFAQGRQCRQWRRIVPSLSSRWSLITCWPSVIVLCSLQAVTERRDRAVKGKYCW
jgi:hypothetical protein